MTLPLTNNIEINNIAWMENFSPSYYDKLNNLETTFQIEKLLPLLRKWDKLGDPIIYDYYLKYGYNVGQNSLGNFLNTTNTTLLEENLWSQYFSKIIIQPKWLDKDKLKVGSELCRRTGVSSFIVLRNYCLMGSFITPQLFNPLLYNTNYKKELSKLIADNIEFWFQITRENGLLLGNEGFLQIFKKRMSNSYRRIKTLKLANYNSEKFGIPFNYWNQLAENLSFSLLYLIGLRQLGFKISETESQGLFHLWKYIGYLSGIPSELLPDTEEEAKHSFFLWVSAQPEADENAALLAKALFDEPLTFPFPIDQFSKNLLREIHLFYNHFFLKDRVCEQLNLSKTIIGKFALAHIWQTKKNEMNRSENDSLAEAIKKGGQEQENIRNIQLSYYKSTIVKP